MSKLSNLKNFVKKILPDDLYYFYKLHKLSKNQDKINNKEWVKKETNKEYFKINHRNINWENPQTYTEKINVSKIFGGNEEIKTKLTDKYEVREWVKEKIGEDYLIPALGVYDDFNDIDFSKLPDKFVIKCTHDSGSTTICDKNNMNIKKLEKLYNNYYLKRDFSLDTYEKHYHNIKHRIIIEQCMGKAINDYKFLCFNGQPYYCWIDVDRFGNHKRNIYDMNWVLQPFQQMTYGNYKNEIKCPKNFKKMIEIAQKLCEGFDHVRVDLYNIDGKIYFGEMTFTNGSGFEIIDPEEWDYKLGKLWKLNIKSNKNKEQK